jgi:hypothetical protein
MGMETKQVHERAGQTFLQFIHLQKHVRSRGADIWHVKVGLCVCLCLHGLLLSSPAPDSSKVQSLKAAFRPSQLLF